MTVYSSGHRNICIYIFLLYQVESVPLEEIRKASLLTEKLLCDKLDWASGIEAAKACQVINKQTN